MRPVTMMGGAMLLGMVAVAGEAQLPRRAIQAPPTTWVGLAAVLQNPATVSDGATSSSWDFGSTTAFRLSLERARGSGAVFGLAVSHADAPLRYTTSGIGGACGGGCDATAGFTQLLLTGRTGRRASIGLQSSIELGIGATMYSGFRRDSDGSDLPPTSVDLDPTVTIGTSFGFALGPALEIYLVPEWGLQIHQRTGLSGSSDTFLSQSSFRLGARYGF